MLKVPQILVRTLALGAGAAMLAGCGQKGPLFIPQTAAAAQRATLPQTLRPRLPGSGAPATPAKAAPTPDNIPPLTPGDLVPETNFQPVTSSPSSPSLP